MTYSAEVLADSPLVYFRLAETSGSAILDASGNAHNGAYVGTPTFSVTGLINDPNKAITLSGSGQYGTVAYGSWMNQAAITVEAWIKTTGTGTHSIFDRDSSTRPFQFRHTNGVLEFIRITNAAGSVSVVVISTTGVTVNDGNTHHVVATYDGTNVKLYVDGVLKGSGTASGGLQQPAGGLMSLAANDSGSFNSLFVGTLDEVAYYGSALSAARVLAHYNAGLTAPPPDVVIAGNVPGVVSAFPILGAVTPDYVSTVLADSPLVYWRLDETSGTVAADASGNARPGTYLVAPTTATGLLPNLPSSPSVDFNKNNFARIAAAAWQDPATWSAEFWYNADGTNSAEGMLFAHMSAANAQTAGNRAFYVGLRPTTGILEAELVFTDATFLNLPLDASAAYGVTRHVVVTWDGTWVRGYINGVQVASSNAAAGKTVRTSTGMGITVGADSDTNNFTTTRADARIDEAAYYGTALTAARVAAHYANGAGVIAQMAGNVPGVQGLFNTSGQVGRDVTLAGTIPGVTAAFGVDIPSFLSFAPNLPGLMGAIGGDVVMAASFAPNLTGLSAAFQGDVKHAASFAPTLPGLAGSFVIETLVHVVMDGPLPQPVSSISIDVVDDVRFDGLLGNLMGQFVIALNQLATFDATLPALQAHVDLDAVQSVSFNVALTGVVSDFHLDAIINASGQAILPNLHSAIIGDVVMDASFSGALTSLQGAIEVSVVIGVAFSAALNPLTGLFEFRLLGLVRWWDGAELKAAHFLGVWDGEHIAPTVTLGWWDGSQIQPLV